MGKREFFFVSVFIVVILTALIIYFNSDNKSDYVDTTIAELPSKAGYPPVFIKRKVWGLTGDKQIVVISNVGNEDFKPQKSNDYIYEGLFEIFYKLQHDTLFIYTLVSSPVPNKFSSPYKIVQVELDNPELMDLIEYDNYKKKGLKKVE
ncbi:hypothetical protein SAMN05518672_106202 [Chitinophaga sp. CF118]|uniref:hypothetical protein n=1 Tax=Chitinophaga sp. CF118 TaxID=1884367 RepID=UPI0008E7DFEC|nr:hypothetical protein [Chitinophaga sp. CF118]SFE46081.1 hypothetical protein SAMN05518672_106202 [Chitinophaga sp. CF118]